MIDIKIIADDINDSSPEYHYCLRIKQSFEELDSVGEGNLFLWPEAIFNTGHSKEIDIVMIFIGHLELTDFHIPLKKPGSLKRNARVIFESGVYTIEIKEHSSENQFNLKGEDLLVRYTGGWKNVTKQSHEQVRTLANYFGTHNITKFDIDNLIWLPKAPAALRNIKSDNILFGDFNIRGFLKVAANSRWNKIPDEKKEYWEALIIKGVYKDQEALIEFLNSQEDKTEYLGKSTNQKINSLLKKEVSQNVKAAIHKIGNEPVFIHGQPGSGKTLHLIQMACRLSVERGEKVMLVTFNLPLTQDIKRTLRKLRNEWKENFNVYVTSREQLIWDMIQEVLNPDKVRITELLRENLAEAEELKLLVAEAGENSNFLNETESLHNTGYLLIDEGQDWHENYKALFYAIYGMRNCAVAIGKGQDLFKFSDNHVNANWGQGIKEKHHLHLAQNFRNKANLVNYINEFGTSQGFDFKLEANSNLEGGTIYLIDKWDSKINEETTKILKNREAADYDLLVLVNQEDFENASSSVSEYRLQPIDLDERSRLPENNRPRISKYTTSRGLEGDIVVLWGFDDLYKKIQNNPNFKDNAKPWLTVVLTRAIDSIIIHFNDPQSSLAKTIISEAENQERYGVISLLH